MLRIGTCLLPTLLLLPLGVLGQEVLPDPLAVPEVDTITPVPPPEIPIGGPESMELEMPKSLKINNQGGPITGDIETGIQFGGPIKIEGDNGLEIFSDTAVLDVKEKSVTVEGGVTIYQGNFMQRGERAVYYYERKFVDTSGLRASVDPLLLDAGKFRVEETENGQVYIGTDAGITTHDVENPNFWVRAKETRIYPGEKIVFKDMRLYAGDTPIFWLPYMSQPMDGELGYHFVPGSRSTWGPFLLNTYGIMLGGETDPLTGEKKDAWLLSRWHLDILTQRGVGLGVDLLDTRKELSEEISGLSLYYLYDFSPETSRNGVPRVPIDPNRYQVELKHRHEFDFPDDADWRLDTNISWLSDRYYLQDFEPSRYTIDPAPDNTIALYRRSDSSLLSLLTRVRVNDFYRSDTRLPEIAYDQARAPLFGLPILHEGSTSLGIIGEKAPDFTRNAIVNPLTGLSSGDPRAQRYLSQLSGYERHLAEQMLALPANDPRRQDIRSQLLDSSYTRLHTYQELSLPSMVGGFLSFTPQVGIGYSNYSSVSGPQGSSDKMIYHMGAETSLKFTKDIGPYQNHGLGLNGMMHIFQPYGAWSWISTDDFEPGDPGVDRLTPTTRPRPLDPSRFTAVDELESWNILRLGARNQILTKRDGQSFNWLYLNSYIDAFLESPDGDQNFSNLYNDLRWHPVPWLIFDMETQFPISNGDSGFSEFSADLRYLPTDRFEFSVGYRWLDGHPVVLDSNRFDIGTYTRVTENWGFGTNHAIETEDGTLELQQYTLHRDLGNWVAGLGFSYRDNRLQDEYGVVFSLTLKEFPSVSLPFEFDAQ